MRLLISVAFGVSITSVAASAASHIRLDYPPPRTLELKDWPCGLEGLTRSDAVTVLEGNQELTVEWTETIDHQSHYRLALLLDGEEFPDPVDRYDHCNPAEESWCIADNLPDQVDGSYSFTFTLPNVSCDQCTLQVIQFMYDSSEPLYYQCADIVIVPQPEDGGAGGAGTSTGGLSGEPPSSASGGQDAVAPGPGEDAPPARKSSGRSGCTIAAGVTQAGVGTGVILLSLFGALSRVRRQRRKPL